MADLPPLPLASMPEVVSRAYNLILGSPCCQTTGGKELLVDLQRLEVNVKWFADRDEAAVRALPKKREARVHRMPPGPDRWKKRSRTFRGIAAAMAEQWGRA